MVKFEWITIENVTILDERADRPSKVWMDGRTNEIWSTDGRERPWRLFSWKNTKENYFFKELFSIIESFLYRKLKNIVIFKINTWHKNNSIIEHSNYWVLTLSFFCWRFNTHVLYYSSFFSLAFDFFPLHYWVALVHQSFDRGSLGSIFNKTLHYMYAKLAHTYSNTL